MVSRYSYLNQAITTGPKYVTITGSKYVNKMYILLL